MKLFKAGRIRRAVGRGYYNGQRSCGSKLGTRIVGGQKCDWQGKFRKCNRPILNLKSNKNTNNYMGASWPKEGQVSQV